MMSVLCQIIHTSGLLCCKVLWKQQEPYYATNNKISVLLNMTV